MTGCLGRVLDLLDDPVHEVLRAGVHTRHRRPGTTDAVGHHSDQIEPRVAGILFWDHQRSTGIALASILASGQDAGTEHGRIELIGAEVALLGRITLDAHIVLVDGNLELVENVGGFAALLGLAPASDKGHVADVGLGDQRLGFGHANGRDLGGEGHVPFQVQNGNVTASVPSVVLRMSHVLKGLKGRQIRRLFQESSPESRTYPGHIDIYMRGFRLRVQVMFSQAHKLPEIEERPT